MKKAASASIAGNDLPLLPVGIQPQRPYDFCFAIQYLDGITSAVIEPLAGPGPRPDRLRQVLGANRRTDISAVPFILSQPLGGDIGVG